MSSGHHSLKKDKIGKIEWQRLQDQKRYLIPEKQVSTVGTFFQVFEAFKSSGLTISNTKQFSTLYQQVKEFAESFESSWAENSDLTNTND